MNAYDLTLAAVALMRERPDLCIHQALTRAANNSDAPEDVIKQTFALANLFCSLSRRHTQMQADELLAQLNDAADEIDQLKGERLPARREPSHGAS